MKKNNFEICVRGIVVQKEKILICKLKRNENYFFPGGHVEFGEKADKALARELKEEIGAVVGKFRFIGTNENFYRQRGMILHEINIIFEVALRNKFSKVLEDHMEFRWVTKKDLAKMEVYPIAIRNSVLKWLMDKKIFWTSQGF